MKGNAFQSRAILTMLILSAMVSGPASLGILWTTPASADVTGPPVITDLSQVNATTGGTFLVQANVTANVPLMLVGVWHWTDDDLTLNWTDMVHQSADLYLLTVNVSVNASFFNYRIWALDSSSVDNSTNTSIMNITVKDDRSPFIANFTTNGTLDPATGEPVEFEAVVWDNVQVANVSLNISCNAWANWTRINMSNGTEPGSYNLTLDVPVTCTHLWTKVEAYDPSGNKAVSSAKDALVRDIVSPTLADMTSGSPENDKWFPIKASATDNIGMASVIAMVSFNGNPPWSVIGLAQNATSGLWEGSVFVQVNASSLNLSLNATDTADNWEMVHSAPRTVLDPLKPVINLTLPVYIPMNSTFPINVGVSDNRGVSGVWVEYKLDGGALLVKNLARSAATGRYSTDLQVANISTLDVAVAAVDSVGNENRTPLTRISVVDLTLPEIWIEDDPAPTTGDAMVVHFRVSDNIGVDWTGVVYWFDEGNMTNATFLGVSTGRYSYDVQVPANATIMNLLVTVRDPQGNVANELKSVAVLDDDPPTFFEDDMDLEVTTGDLVPLGTLLDFVTDNIGVGGMSVEYWLGDLHSNMNISNRTSGALMVPSNATYLRFRITAWDMSNNTAVSRLHNIDVRDNDPPVIDLIMQPGTKAVPGRDLEIAVMVRDNIGVSSVVLSAQGAQVPLEEDPDLPDVWAVTIIVGTGNLIGQFHYTINATDVVGNQNATWDISLAFDMSVGPALIDYDIIWIDATTFDVMANVSDNVGIAHVYLEGTGKDADIIPKTDLSRMGDVRADGSMAMYLRVTGFKGEGMASFKITVVDSEGNDVFVTFSENVPEAARSSEDDNTGMITAMLSAVIFCALLYVVLIIYRVRRQAKEGRWVDLEQNRYIKLMPKPQTSGTKKASAPKPDAKGKAAPRKEMKGTKGRNEQAGKDKGRRSGKKKR